MQIRDEVENEELEDEEEEEEEEEKEREGGETRWAMMSETTLSFSLQAMAVATALTLLAAMN